MSDYHHRVVIAARLDKVGRQLAPLKPDAFLHPRPALEQRVLATLTAGLIPVLVGPTGCGRTSIVQSVACSLADADPTTPKALHGMRIIQLDPTSIVGDCFYTSNLENKIHTLASNAIKERAILFLPSIDTFYGIGASSDDPNGDVLQLLVPQAAQQEGGLLLIATATALGWKRLRQDRPDFAHKCLAIDVPEPDAADARRIVQGHADRIRIRSGLAFDAAALDGAAELGRALRPDAAAPGDACDVLRIVQASSQARCLQRPGSLAATTTIDAAGMIAAVSEASGLPRSLLTPDAAQARDSILARLRDRVIGQDAVLEPLANRIAMIQHRLIDPDRPAGVFLLTGPSGCGKTETAKAVAEALHGSASSAAFHRFDMSEYVAEDSWLRFVGSKRTGVTGGISLIDVGLAGAYRVILLDELEKAHANVFNVLLQVFGERRLTDAQGRTASFATTTFLCTSNLAGTDRALGFTDVTSSHSGRSAESAIPRAVLEFFRPEFVNRINAVLPFQHLSREAVEQIAHRAVVAFAARGGLKRRNISLVTTDAATAHLLHIGYSRDFGARPMQRAVDRELGAACVRWLEQHPTATDFALVVDHTPDSGTVIRDATPIAPVPVSPEPVLAASSSRQATSAIPIASRRAALAVAAARRQDTLTSSATAKTTPPTPAKATPASSCTDSDTRTPNLGDLLRAALRDAPTKHTEAPSADGPREAQA